MKKSIFFLLLLFNTAAQSQTKTAILDKARIKDKSDQQTIDLCS